MKLQNDAFSLKSWPCDGVENPQFPPLKAQHHFCLHGDEFVGISVPTVGTWDAVVSQRPSRAHLHPDILACLHAGGDDWLQAAELGMSETPAELISAWEGRWCDSSSSDWLWAAELMNICWGETSSAPLPPSHLCPAHQRPTALRVSFNFWTRCWGSLCFRDLPRPLAPSKTPRSHPRSERIETRE